MYHINQDNNVQPKFSASQYGFRAGVFTETALHEFARRVEHCLARKKAGFGYFPGYCRCLRQGLLPWLCCSSARAGQVGMSKILTSWIENLVRHRTVQVELYGDKVKGEVVKGNPQGGILSPFLWNCS